MCYALKLCILKQGVCKTRLFQIDYGGIVWFDFVEFSLVEFELVWFGRIFLVKRDLVWLSLI